MRIISKFHDYYDSAMGYGVDYDSIWLRKTEKLERGVGPASCSSWSRYKLDISYESHTIGFCGKVYGCIVVKKHNNDGKVTKKAICYNLVEVDAFVEANSKKKQIEYYYSKEPSWWRGRYANLCFGAKHITFKNFFKKFEDNRDKYEKFFIDNNSPVFVDKTVNASLKEWEFYRVFDPYTAFQEIQMFFGKLRSPERPIPPVSDSDMLEAKGFDPKWSFRKEPGKKRKKRKK